LTADLDPVGALKIAMLAEDAGAKSKAIELLTSASDGLHAQEDIEDALDLGVKLRHTRLTGAFDIKLSSLFAAFTGLRNHRLSGFLRDRDYAAAAALFKGDPSRLGREDFEYFNELSGTLRENGELDVAATIRRLSERLPGRRRQSLRACARHLEAHGRRGAAVQCFATPLLEPPRRIRPWPCRLLAANRASSG